MDRLNAGELAAVETACRLLGRHIEEPVEVVWMRDA
jgi:hypothetical protein